MSMNNLAVTLRAQGDLNRARELREKVLEISRRVLGEEHPDTLRSMNNLAESLSAQGDLNRARELQEKVLEIRRRILGEKHPDTSNSEWNLLMSLLKLGEQSAAKAVSKNLAWLLERTPESLGAVHRQIRSNLEQLLKR
jgi:tetratricopeptide (TPR) repeat protein